MIVVATDNEYKLAKERFKNDTIIQTGVGGINVIKALKDIPKETKIINFGYVGSNSLPIGTEVKIGASKLYHPHVEYDEVIYRLRGDVTCYTSNDFVLHTEIKTPVVFDMELAFIMALGFKNIESIKIVSDNLNKEEYYETV